MVLPPTVVPTHAPVHSGLAQPAVQAQPKRPVVQQASGLVHGGTGGAPYINGRATPHELAPQGPTRPSMPAQVAARPAVADDCSLEVALSFLEQRRSSSDERDQAYSAFLRALADWGALEGLPVGASGTLRVGAPFCHDFFEAPLLLPFLVERLVDGGRARGVSAFGSDLNAQPFWWRAWEQWTAHALGPRAELVLRQQDLEKEAMPEADLILACHPEVTNGGPWPRILGNVLRSRSSGAQCVFATFYRQEAEAAAKVCRDYGVDSSIRENPYYTGQPETIVGTFLRYAVILARTPGSGTCQAPTVPAASPEVVQQVVPAAQPAPCSRPPLSAPPCQGPVRVERSVVQTAPALSTAGVLDSTIHWVDRRRASPDQRDTAYGAFLQALAGWGCFEGLPTDAAGTLQVSAPFCQEFFEAPLLLPFLAQRLLGPGGAAGISAFGCDVQSQPFWWPAWEEWTAHSLGPQVRLELRQSDLAQEQPPPAGLILAVHPEVTKGGPWHSILRNVLQSRAPGAQCVFATFYASEAQETLKVCRALGAEGEIRENPHHAGRPADSVGTFLRYAVIMSRC